MSSKPRSKGFTDLKSLRKTLEAQEKAAAAARAEAARQAQAQQQAAADFRRLVGEVQPLHPKHERVMRRPPAPPPLPLKRWEDEQEVLKESISDEFGDDWLIETDDTLSYRRSWIGPDVVRKLRRGHWTVQHQLDLHGLRVDEARDTVGHFLRHCVKQDLRCVRVIHGKGLGSVNRIPVLKEKVRRWLVQKDEVLAFVEARPADGGSGVVLVLLKSPQQLRMI